jgi:hypothetical protein
MLALKKNPGKAVRDSHTPQMMKLQILFPPALIASIALSALADPFLYLSLILFFLFIITTIPFTAKAFMKDSKAGLLSPVLLFFRATAQFFGVIRGIGYVSKKM